MHTELLRVQQLFLLFRQGELPDNCYTYVDVIYNESFFKTSFEICWNKFRDKKLRNVVLDDTLS